MKSCFVFNMAPLYRKGIYYLMDNNFDADWYFSKGIGNIKTLDINKLKNAKIVNSIFLFKSNWYYQYNIVNLLFRRDYDKYLMLGDLFCISTWLLLLLRKVLFLNKKIYLWTHGWYGRESLIKRILKRFYFSLADGIFLYGNYAKKLMISHGFDASKLFVIHNSLDYDKQLAIRYKLTLSDIYKNYFNNNYPVLVFIGRITKVKRLDLLLESLNILKNKGEVYNLVIIGDGEEKSQLQYMVNSLSLQNNVWFYGACYDEYMNAMLLYNADLCVSPGNVGLTAIHSMSFGTPVITHNNYMNQMPEFESIINEQTGAFFDYDNTLAIANCISNWFINHEKDREIIRSKCYDVIDKEWNPNYQIDILRRYFK